MTRVSWDILFIARGKVPLHKFSDDEGHSWSREEDSALRRSIFNLAVTMVHELCHALENAVTLRLDDSETYIPEPFYSDHRIAELGYAFERVLFGGVIEPLGYYQAAPYGLVITEWPGIAEVGSEISPGVTNHSGSAERGSPIKYGCTKFAVYPIHMFYIAKFFTQEFWEREVPERQLEAFIPPRDEELVAWKTDNDFRDD